MKNDNCLPSIYQGQPTPIVGFILQKDVYTTNLLYANDQFSTKSLRKRLPFRTGSGRKPNNPSSSLTILRQNGYMSENSEDEDLFYMRNTFRPKKLRNKHLKFPLPKIKPVPLTNAILREDICKQDVRIKYMEDDLNITSKFGKKIFYNLKENNRPYETNFPINNNLKLMKDKEVDKDVKFQYNQSATIWIIYVIINILTRILIRVSLGFLFFTWIFALVELVLLVFVIITIVKAFSDESYEIPVISDLTKSIWK